MSTNYTQNTIKKFETDTIKEGDVFSEMMTHWKFIVRRKGDMIVSLEGNKNKNYKIVEYANFEEFKKTCSYESIEDYWVTYLGHHPDRCEEYLKQYKTSRSWPASFTNEGLNKQKKRNFEIEKILYDL